MRDVLDQGRKTIWFGRRLLIEQASEAWSVWTLGALDPYDWSVLSAAKLPVESVSTQSEATTNLVN